MTQNELLRQIHHKGIQNIRFMAPFKDQGTITPLGLMTRSSDPDIPMKCRIDESRYKVADRYKITLTPCDKNWYSEHFYLLDLCSLIERGIVKICE